MSKRFHGPYLSVECDRTEIIPDDPGAGTPVMVYVGQRSATYQCAVDTGEVDGLELTRGQLAWLTSLSTIESINAALGQDYLLG